MLQEGFVVSGSTLRMPLAPTTSSVDNQQQNGDQSLSIGGLYASDDDSDEGLGRENGEDESDCEVEDSFGDLDPDDPFLSAIEVMREDFEQRTQLTGV